MVKLRVLRPADFSTPCVHLGVASCERCGAVVNDTGRFVSVFAGLLKQEGLEVPQGTIPIDFLRSVQLTHAWDKDSRASYCGGRVRFAGERS